MAVGSADFPPMYPVNGIRLGTAKAGIKKTQQDDLLLMDMVEGGCCAAVFTRNAFCAAPVRVAKEHLTHSPLRLLVNSGNANAGTGEQGIRDALACCSKVAEIVGGKPSQVLPFSTGVIGENLPVQPMFGAFPELVADLSTDHWHQAAQAIMTTDTFAKGASTRVRIGEEYLTITGICKGSGMIHPDMATMLAFLATDACIDQALLQRCLAAAVEDTFNRVTVDGDTSTNDACVLLASGQTTVPQLEVDSEAYRLFLEALRDVCGQLAEAIVRDGEGATKLMRIVVTEATHTAEAVAMAKTIAHSPLVKTAFFAGDPNWGRILAAVGRAPTQNLNVDGISIFLDEVCIVANGGRAASYSESDGQRVMNREDITVTVKLGRGEACATVYTCDLSYEYVRINAEYRS